MHWGKNCLLVLGVALLFSCNRDKAHVLDEKLVYLKNNTNNFDLFTSDVLGQWEDRLTTNPGWDWSPRWNTGLEKMVYYSNDTAGDFSVLAMRLNTGEVDTLPNADLLNFKLSPSGKYIYYNEEDSLGRNIWRCKLDGTAKERLTEVNGYNGRFEVNADESQMAFISDRTGQNELLLMNLKTKNVKQLTNDEMIEKYISWSPDGKQIAFTMAAPSDDPKWDIYMINADGTGLVQLTKTPYSEQEIAWSLSGKKIAFHGTTAADGDHIYTIDIANGKFTKITSGDYYHGEPAWVPARAF